MESAPISRRALFRLGASALALAVGRFAGLAPAWAGPGPSDDHEGNHHPEEGEMPHRAQPEAGEGKGYLHDHAELADPHIHDEPPHHEAHGPTSDGHSPARGGHAHGEHAPGHAGHGHGKEGFEKYGLVRASRGYKEYNVKLSQFQFQPAVFRVERGDRVRFNLDSVDVTHGFYVDGYGVSVAVPEKEQKTVEFVADRPGAFRIRCAVTCGPFHPFMIGKLVVSPNRQFWFGAAAALLVPAALLTFFAWRERNGS